MAADHISRVLESGFAGTRWADAGGRTPDGFRAGIATVGMSVLGGIDGRATGADRNGRSDIAGIGAGRRGAVIF
jgi:hypothetical protein